MLELDALFDALASNGLARWRETLEPALYRNSSARAHGDLPAWRSALDALPAAATDHPAPRLESPLITAGPRSFETGERAEIKTNLLRLQPWRKGPFRVGDILIDAEWRSDMKWSRLERAISPPAGRLVLDVGCGNGYYTLRMLGAGARLVLGIDPMLLYVIQHLAIRRFMPPVAAHVLPLELQELPAGNAFDTVFSMGVLYHQRAPAKHLADLRSRLAPGGELVLETLVLPGSGREVLTPGRYARMRNVWELPTVPLLLDWLEEAHFTDVRLADVSLTTPAEQRSTEWMPFESLDAALDAGDPSRTVEGWPAPRRAIVVCRI